MPAKSIDIAWLAGILEGEGTFSCKDNGTNALIKIAMVDGDIIERVACILNYNGTITESITKSFKPIFTIQLYGNEAIQWMMTIYSLMGTRRKEKIRSILILWKHYERVQKTHCINGHEYTEDNSYFTPEGIRACRICRQVRSLEHQEKRRNDPVYKEKHRLAEQDRRNKLREVN